MSDRTNKRLQKRAETCRNLQKTAKGCKRLQALETDDYFCSTNQLTLKAMENMLETLQNNRLGNRMLNKCATKNGWNMAFVDATRPDLDSEREEKAQTFSWIQTYDCSD